jgi:hypothetical protein
MAAKIMKIKILPFLAVIAPFGCERHVSGNSPTSANPPCDQQMSNPTNAGGAGNPPATSP